MPNLTDRTNQRGTELVDELSDTTRSSVLAAGGDVITATPAAVPAAVVAAGVAGYVAGQNADS